MDCSIQYFVHPLGTAWNEGHAQRKIEPPRDMDIRHEDPSE